MKASNKLLVVIIMVVVAYMVVFDAGLKAEYLKGDFKNPFFGMEQLPIKDFNSIDHQAANVIDATIEKGPKFTIWVKKEFKDSVQIVKQGKTLVIRYIGQGYKHMFYSGIKITCPQLENITTKAFIPKSWGEDRGNSYHDDIDVIGFDQEKMTVNPGPLTEIELKNNKLVSMEAIVGDNSNDIGGLNVNSNNYIKSASIKVLGKSELKMANPNITKLEHSISDSASLILSGSAVRLLK
ncbi:MAG: hypothetical protein EOP47_10365 [Sphingobacteriaceae bacterium]|nr:MAG: hypothetical protein EOP47_10365 [Sphingobacteriaceae bacterium]